MRDSGFLGGNALESSFARVFIFLGSLTTRGESTNLELGPPWYSRRDCRTPRQQTRVVSVL